MRASAVRAGEPPPAVPRRRRRRWWIALPALLALLAGLLVWRARDTPGTGLAARATVSASSTALGASARDLVDAGSAAAPGAAWRSAGETVGAWVELAWPRPTLLRQVVLVRDTVTGAGITDGFLRFGDGSLLQVRLSATDRVTVLPISARLVDRVRFTVSGVGPGTTEVGLAEVLVDTAPAAVDVARDAPPDGNVAPQATVTQSPAAGGDPAALRDGSTTTGADWAVARPEGVWVQLTWPAPRELAAVQVVGSAGGGPARLAAATLVFSDGSTLPVGAVLGDPGRPTTIGFMPRTTSSLRLRIDRVSGTGPLALGELRAYQVGSTPLRSQAAGPPDPPLPDAAGCPDPVPAAPPGAGLVVRCPATGSVVDATVTARVAAEPGYTGITAAVWPADPARPAGPTARATPDPAGTATLTLDLGSVPPGPFTVAFAAAGPGRPDAVVYFQLYRRGPAPAGDPAPSPRTAGRTLVYDEEFDRPLGLSRSGADADYATAKPTHDGEQDFGDAIFADPRSGPRTVQVVDGRYLRIGVEPNPPGFTDPQGWGRTHLGGLLASARPGGSGFSAQYGYFEARLLAPAAPGTWPAFWLLPGDNLIAPTPAVAEIDAVELYGHEPRGACHSTHEYVAGRDGGVARCGERFGSARAALAWHTYGASVTPTEIVFTVDGRVVAAAPQVRGGGAPMFFLLDLALGGGWPVQLQGVQDRAALYVDYVRVYV